MPNLNMEHLENKLKAIKAGTIMSKFAITIKDDERITILAHLMMRFKISGVPVINKNGETCGIVTATDLFNLMRAIISDIDDDLELIKYQNIKVNNIMTKDAVSITEDTSLFEIAKIMCEKSIHTLPIMGITKNEIVGVIGRRDILNAFYTESKKDLSWEQTDRK